MSFRSLKALFLGRPLKTFEIAHEKLPKWQALAVFSSDALSSVAYATQEILIPLSLFSIAAMNWSLLIAVAIAALLAIVALSYSQTIKAYPSGGGAYSVVMENLGVRPGLVTAAALLVDYVLTVSVSIAAGVEAISSAAPYLFEHRVLIGCLAILVVTLVNLRGIRESGSIFSIPTYLFIFSIVSLLGFGFCKLFTGDLAAKAPILEETYPAISLFLVLRAFASGCAALTGVEAISNGVQTFRKPQSKNARITLAWMTLILAAFFLGITALAHQLLIVPSERETVISQIARQVFGGGVGYYSVQLCTAMILFLAANTSFADFPRVCSLLAQDRFMPRQLALIGDRLVFSNGIFLLGLVSGLLLILFEGATHKLIPLYAIGVFLSFTASQVGMVKHHIKKKEKFWPFSIITNATGALVTFIVLIIITVTKFTHGAWIIVIVIPIISLWFRSTREHYRKAAAQLAMVNEVDFKTPINHVVVVPISGLHKGVIDALKYAKSISKDVRVIYVDLDPDATERLKTSWNRLNVGVDLSVLKSPYRSVIEPLLKYIRSVDAESHDDMLTVVIPEFVPARWWQSIYHNQTALVIRAALLFERGKVVTTVRYHLTR